MLKVLKVMLRQVYYRTKTLKMSTSFTATEG
jgi:hypothetical protein